MGIGQTLSYSYPAVADSVPRAREALSKFAQSVGVRGDQLDAIRLAVSEAATNAVVHAYEGDAGQIQVDAALGSGDLWVLVADDGYGMRPRIDSPGLGVGLALISQVCDEFAIAKSASGGTEVRMRFGLREGGLDWTDGSGGSIAHAVDAA
jgi:anti-sigma regulatory factor (Ser/Thr protein kinase)